MHRSRIGVVLIDVPAEDHDGAERFWSGVVGRPPTHPDADADYSSLGRIGPLNLEVQRTGPGTPARLHLDVETDDVGAEIARLQALGATVHTELEHFTVMRDPAGLQFCVVPVQTGDAFAADATSWP